MEFLTHLTFEKDVFLHTHSFYEIFYIIEGQIYHIHNNKKDLLSVGDVFILRPNDIHCFERFTSCTHRDIMVPVHKFKMACDFLDKKLFDNINFGGSPYRFKITSEQMANLEESLTYIRYMSDNVLKYRSTLTNSFLAHILGYIYYSDSNIEQNNYPKWLLTILQKLAEPEFLKIGIDAIKKETNYNYIYISRVFKEKLGQTITEYINFKRLELAKLYLTTTKLNITEISKEVRFNYPYRFNQLFKEYNKCTPIQYRKKYEHPD